MEVKSIQKEEPTFIGFDSALQVFHSLGVPIGKTTLYNIIKDEPELPCKMAFGRYFFDREKLILWIKKTLEN